MGKLIALIALVFSLSIFGGVSSASADERCEGQKSDACEVFLRQQEAPAFRGPKSGKLADRCVWVANPEPVALVLRAGAGVTGPGITSWRLSALSWRRGTVNGKQSMLTQICFDSALLYNYDAVTLCAEVGHSIWRGKNLAYVRKHNVSKGDPACVGGDAWCADRGL